jgi:excisionase family DNA binding protein
MPLLKRDKTGAIVIPSVTKSAIQIQPAPKVPPAITVSAAPKTSLPKRWAGNLERIGVSAEEAAVMLGLSVRSVWTLVKDERIRHVRFGTRVIIAVESIREFVNGRQEPISHSASIDE